MLCYHIPESGAEIVHYQEGIDMNLYQQLLVVHERLEGIGEHDDTTDLVEKLLQRSEATKNDKTNITQINVLRHMLRMPEVSDNYHVYNDLQELISERDESDVAA